MAMSEVKLGKPKYEQGTKNYFSFKKGQDMFILRILPPMGELADEGKWSVYHRVEFGYTGTDGRMKPFLSPRKVNYDKMVEVESLAHVRREGIKAQEAEAKASGNKALEEQCKTLLSKYNQDAKHYMNAIDLQGNIGLFKIGHKGFQAFKAEIDRLRSEGVDPVGIDNGRYFVFARSGKGRDTLYTTTEYKQKVTMEQGGESFVVDKPFPHAITPAIMSKLGTDSFELNKVYPSVTSEQEKLIVEGGPAGVDSVFKKPEAKANPASNAQEAPAQTAGISPEAIAAAAQPAPEANTAGYSAPAESVPQPESTTTVTTNTGETTVSINTGEVLNETPAAQAQPETPTPTEAPIDAAGMSEEEFFKKVQSGQF